MENNYIRAKCCISSKYSIPVDKLEKIQKFVDNFKSFAIPPKIGDSIYMPLNILFSVKITQISHDYDENGPFLNVGITFQI
jgi:hypothetical protein